MRNSLTRRSVLSGLAGLGAAAVINKTSVASDTTPETYNTEGDPPPARDYLKETGRGWRVSPTGIDDTENLEWALRNTPAGGTVRLASGNFKVAHTIIVPDFDGNLVGAGADKTTITCTDEFNYEIWEAAGAIGSPPPRFPRIAIEGSSTRAAPGVILFYKSPPLPGEDPADRANRIEIRDIRCRGAMRGDDWTFGDEVLCFTIANSIDWMSPETTPPTTRQDVLISGVEVDGYASEAFPVFGNSCACITVIGGLVLTDNYDLEGSVDGDMFGTANGGLLGVVPAEGDVTFVDCGFKNCRVGPGVVGYKDGRLLFDNIRTDGCKGNCLQFLDNSGCRMEVRDCDLFCDSFLLPPELAIGGATDVPSSLGCVVAIQGVAAAAGIGFNLRWLTLAVDTVAHDAHPEAGPFGTWRPLGPAFAPAQPCTLKIIGTSCLSSQTENTYCFHVVDLSYAAFGLSSISAEISNNGCNDSQTCMSLEHITQARVWRNDCESRDFGVELYNSAGVEVQDNTFNFPGGTGCEVRILAPGEKIDLSRVVPGAGSCVIQPW